MEMHFPKLFFPRGESILQPEDDPVLGFLADAACIPIIGSTVASPLAAIAATFYSIAAVTILAYDVIALRFQEGADREITESHIEIGTRYSYNYALCGLAHLVNCITLGLFFLGARKLEEEKYASSYSVEPTPTLKSFIERLKKVAPREHVERLRAAGVSDADIILNATAHGLIICS